MIIDFDYTQLISYQEKYFKTLPFCHTMAMMMIDPEAIERILKRYDQKQ